MADRIPRAMYPWWVKLSVLGSSGRKAVWMWVWISVALALASVAYAALRPDPRFYAGAIVLLAAFPYWRSICWIDEHGSWERVDS